MNGFGRKNSTDKEKKFKILTRETVGMILILFACLSLLCLITGKHIFGVVGVAVSSFLLGVFGWCAYLATVALIVSGIALVKGAKNKIPVLDRVFISLSVVFLIFLLNAITAKTVGKYGEFLSSAYNRGGEGFKNATAGGVLTCIFDWLFCKLVTRTGTYVLYSLFFVMFFALELFYRLGFFAFSTKDKDRRNKKKFKNVKGAREYPVADLDFPSLNDAGEDINGLYYGEDDFKERDPRRKKTEDVPTTLRYAQGNSGLILLASDEEPDEKREEMQKKLGYIKTPYEIIPDGNAENKQSDTNVYDEYPRRERAVKEEKEEKKDDKKSADERFTGEISGEDYFGGSVNDGNELGGREYFGDTRFTPEPTNETPIKRFDEKNDADIFRGTDDKPAPTRVARDFGAERNIQRNVDSHVAGSDGNSRITPARGIPVEEEKTERGTDDFDITSGLDGGFDVTGDLDGGFKEETRRTETRTERTAERTTRRDSDVTPPSTGMFDFTPVKRQPEPEEEPKIPVVPEKEEAPKFIMPVHIPYNKPSTAMFTEYPRTFENNMAEQTEKTRIIESTLEGFNIPAKVVNIVKGPTVTRYELQMPQGISVNKVNGVANDLAMNLCAATGVIIEAPIPGKNLFGIQVENKNKVTVGLRDILESKEFSADGKGKLLYSIGKDIVGNIRVENLAKAPHLLVAGATGTGKSVCLNSLIISLICKYGPEDLRLILVDPKQVEFSMYAHIPHLLFDQILTDVQTTIATLDWLVNEMERRYTCFSEAGVTDINMYNDTMANDDIPKMPRIVVIVDELADFMATRKRDMEDRIQRLAAKARAAGIHLVLATQRPSVDVITGVIKANLPTRIACKVSSVTDAMTIFGESGAEKLLGNGDLLYKSSTMFNCDRMQGSFVSNAEIHNAVKFIRENNTCYFDPKILEQINNIAHPVIAERTENGAEETAKKESKVDELFDSAVRHVIKLNSASATNLQAKFQIGYSTATRLLQQMVDKGIVSEYQGSKSRTVLMSLQEYEEKYCNGNGGNGDN